MVVSAMCSSPALPVAHALHADLRIADGALRGAHHREAEEIAQTMHLPSRWRLPCDHPARRASAADRQSSLPRWPHSHADGGGGSGRTSSAVRGHREAEADQYEQGVGTARREEAGGLHPSGGGAERTLRAGRRAAPACSAGTRCAADRAWRARRLALSWQLARGTDRVVLRRAGNAASGRRSGYPTGGTMIDLQDPKTAALLMLDAMDVGTARIVNNHLAKRVGV